MDGQELLRLLVYCYKSLRRKYPARVRRTPKFEAWQRFLEEQVGRESLGFNPKDDLLPLTRRSSFSLSVGQ